MIWISNNLTGRTARKGFFVAILGTAVLYLIIERMGLFRMGPASFREVLHSVPMRGLSIFCAVYALVAIVPTVRKQSSRRARARSILFFISILVFVAALWTSVYTRFEGKAIRMENTVFNAFKQDYVPPTLFIAKHAKLPEVGVHITKIRPAPAADMQSMTAIHADIKYAGRTTSGILPGTLSASWPLVSDWTMVSITDFGYAAKYTLFDLRQQELESNTLFMNLFPAGAEDYFETMFLGYVFYLRLYPDSIKHDGIYGTRSLEPKDPLYTMRIVRHKDIVYNGPLKSGKKLQFDNVVISLGEPKMWVEMSFVRDLGVPLALVGCLLMTGAIAIFLIDGHARR